jgi:hypothetical protein
MIKTLLSSVMFVASFVPAIGEVEYEIHTGYSDKTTPSFRDNILELRTYHAAPGKLDALLTRFREHTCKLFSKHGMTNVGYWVPVENPDNLLIYLMAYPSKEIRDASWKDFMADPEWKKTQSESEVDGRLVEKVDQIFMTPTDFSEGFSAVSPDKPNVSLPSDFHPAPAGSDHLFEMRTYTSTPENLENLQARFRDHTLGLFKKHGITNLAYFEFTPDQPGAKNTLLYFLAHKDRESAKKSWAEFSADPDWIAAKKASEEKAGGSLTEKGGVKSIFLTPTDFSPVK